MYLSTFRFVQYSVRIPVLYRWEDNAVCAFRFVQGEKKMYVLTHFVQAEWEDNFIT